MCGSKESYVRHVNTRESVRRKNKTTYDYRVQLSAFFLLISFTLLNVFNPTFAQAQPPTVSQAAPSINPIDPATFIQTLKLPEEFGTIQDQFLPETTGGKADQMVIYLQDAHGNYDAETNIRKLIGIFQEKYGLSLVFLEGGEGRLDSLFFRSFPDEVLKE